MASLADMKRYFDGFFKAIEVEQSPSEYKFAMQLAVECGQYIDMLSVSNPHRLHHVYEWGRVGDMSSRLFDINVTPVGKSVVISYSFRPSVTPNKNGHVFADKAEVMESGRTVSFDTNKPVPIEDTFRVGRFSFKPGGNDTTNAFFETFTGFFITRAPNIKTTGYRRSGGLNYSSGYKDGRSIYDSITP